MTARVWQRPDGSLSIFTHAPQSTFTFEEAAAKAGEHPALKGRPFTDMDTAALDALSRTDRHKWRLVGGRVVVDATVPDPPHPRQALLAEIAAASSLAEMRAVLARVVRLA